MESIFKKLVIFDLASIAVIILISLSGITSALLPPELLDWNDYLLDEYLVVYLLSIPIAIIYIVACFMLLKFSPTGRSMYLWITIISFALTLFTGPTISDPLSNLIIGFSGMASGAIFVLMYATPLSEKFQR
tara:strand:- start:2039 stop:2434 length:396 start_codon:yes stop_codon:yes gene_type:complete